MAPDNLAAVTLRGSLLISSLILYHHSSGTSAQPLTCQCYFSFLLSFPFRRQLFPLREGCLLAATSAAGCMCCLSNASLFLFRGLALSVVRALHPLYCMVESTHSFYRVLFLCRLFPWAPHYDMTSAQGILFDALHKAFYNLGAEQEGAIFAELEHLPWVLRAAEFARVDGALIVQGTLPKAASYANRLWVLMERARAAQCPELALMDVKSRVSGDAHEQIYITTIGQRARTAVFIGVCAANPDFIEVIPNLYAGRPFDKKHEGRCVAVNISRKSLLPASAYGHLSPCNSATRMPIGYLDQALEGILACARGEGDYVNPWTRVRFGGWKPFTVQTSEDMMPKSNTQHFTAYRSAMEIFRCVRNARRWNDPLPLDFDMLYLQPRVADFKLIIEDSRAHDRRQVFVQHKIDGQDRSRNAKLVNVAIARGREDGTTMWYFTPFER